MTINDAVVNWLPESILGKESLIAKAALILESFCQNQLNLCFLWITDMMKPEHCSLTSQSRWELDLDKTREAAMVWTTSALLAGEKGKTTYPQTCSPALPGADALGPWARRVCIPWPGKKDWLPLAAWISSRENPARGSCRKTVCLWGKWWCQLQPNLLCDMLCAGTHWWQLTWAQGCSTYLHTTTYFDLWW